MAEPESTSRVPSSLSTHVVASFLLGALRLLSQTQAITPVPDGDAGSGFERLISNSEKQTLPWKLLIWQMLSFIGVFA